MERRFYRRTSYRIAFALIFISLCVAGPPVLNAALYRPVDHAQQEMIARVKDAHLLGAGKQSVIAFFGRQHLPYRENYDTLETDGGNEQVGRVSEQQDFRLDAR